MVKSIKGVPALGWLFCLLRAKHQYNWEERGPGSSDGMRSTLLLACVSEGGDASDVPSSRWRRFGEL